MFWLATSISFDLSVYELFLTLSVGGAVILAENVLQLPEYRGGPDDAGEHRSLGDGPALALCGYPSVGPHGQPGG